MIATITLILKQKWTHQPTLTTWCIPSTAMIMIIMIILMEIMMVWWSRWSWRWSSLSWQWNHQSPLTWCIPTMALALKLLPPGTFQFTQNIWYVRCNCATRQWNIFLWRKLGALLVGNNLGHGTFLRVTLSSSRLAHTCFVYLLSFFVMPPPPIFLVFWKINNWLKKNPSLLRRTWY